MRNLCKLFIHGNSFLCGTELPVHKDFAQALFECPFPAQPAFKIFTCVQLQLLAGSIPLVALVLRPSNNRSCNVCLPLCNDRFVYNLLKLLSGLLAQ